jgi:hypothetical protein
MRNKENYIKKKVKEVYDETLKGFINYPEPKKDIIQAYMLSKIMSIKKINLNPMETHDILKKIYPELF